MVRGIVSICLAVLLFGNYTAYASSVDGVNMYVHVVVPDEGDDDYANSKVYIDIDEELVPLGTITMKFSEDPSGSVSEVSKAVESVEAYVERSLKTVASIPEQACIPQVDEFVEFQTQVVRITQAISEIVDASADEGWNEDSTREVVVLLDELNEKLSQMNKCLEEINSEVAELLDIETRRMGYDHSVLNLWCAVVTILLIIIVTCILLRIAWKGEKK